MCQAKRIQLFLIAILLLFVFNSQNVVLAQPSPAELADRIIDSQQKQLQRINTITIVQEIPFAGVVETAYLKVEGDGHSYLKAVDDDGDDFFFLSTMDGDLRRVIMGASAITTDSFNGNRFYKVFIDDAELLESLDTENFDFDSEEDYQGEMKTATFWVDQQHYNIHRAEIVQEVDGTEMTINIHLKDYKEHSGLYIPYLMEISVDGISGMISEEEIAEARAAMRELEQQLSQMPEAQRRMIEQQLKPQIEQFEAMIDSGSMSMEMTVKEVIVNQ